MHIISLELKLLATQIISQECVLFNLQVQGSLLVGGGRHSLLLQKTGKNVKPALGGNATCYGGRACCEHSEHPVTVAAFQAFPQPHFSPRSAPQAGGAEIVCGRVGMGHGQPNVHCYQGLL
jgi:hypothetical protein